MSNSKPVELGAIVCRHVFEGSRPILYVTRPDGDWLFLCGQNDDDMDNPDFYSVVGVNHLVERDPSLRRTLALVPNEEAERDHVGGDWTMSRFDG